MIAVGCGAQTSPSLSAGPLVSSQRGAPEEKSPANDVAYQVNATHTGYAAGNLDSKLKIAWSVKRGKGGAGFGYPVIANDIVAVVSYPILMALDARTGKILWTQTSNSSSQGWVGPAYDDNTVFVDAGSDCGSGYGLFAFDQRTGKQKWAATPPTQCHFSSFPTAINGSVYTGAAGDGSDVYAYKESDGKLEWTASVESGGDSSPAVTTNGVYVADASPQTYDFNPLTGKRIWDFSGSSGGGSGSTPVVYDGLVFIEQSQALSGYDGLILNAKTGKIAGGFNSYTTPAFADHFGFFGTSGTNDRDGITAYAIPSMRRVWTVTFSDKYLPQTPPLVVGNEVFIESYDGDLYAYNAKTGAQVLDMPLGSSDTYYRSASAALGYGSGELIVPDGSDLIALKSK
jgi:outer membrane protein assembly factor BamB